MKSKCKAIPPLTTAFVEKSASEYFGKAVPVHRSYGNENRFEIIKPNGVKTIWEIAWKRGAYHAEMDM